MMEHKDMNEIAARSLGSSNSYAIYTDKFDSSLLNPMPRVLARQGWGISGKEFVGVDVWHCHEATFLLNNGCPVAGTLKFVYDADTEFMVESKSAKLYLNSFDMCKMGATMAEAIANYESQVSSDLSKTVGGQVKAKFFNSIDYCNSEIAAPFDIYYDDLFKLIGVENIEKMVFDDYYAKENHISVVDGEQTLKVFTNVLRSRCRHTKQKDTGTAFIFRRSDLTSIEPSSLLRQIVSLREVNEFHEFCAEKIFVEIMKKSHENDDVMAALLYSRRGSLDINPIRATRFDLIPHELYSVDCLTDKTQGQ
jgi:7-cyano-7-deazaguanine reductase